MSEEAPEEERGELSKHEGWNDIREKKRSCTDCLVLLLLGACWGAMTLLGFVALGWIEDERLPAGDPNRLLKPMDYDGRICGIDSEVSDKPYAYYLLDTSAVCVESCPTATDTAVFYCKDAYQAGADASSSTGYTYVNARYCMYQVKTQEILSRCFPDGDSSTTAAAAASSSSGGTVDDTVYSAGSTPGWFTTFLEDLYANAGIIFGVGIGVGIVISFVYLYVLRIPGFLNIVIWSVLLSIFFAVAIGGYLLYDMSVTWSNDGSHSQSEADAMLYVSYFIFGIAGLYLCLLTVMRSRVQLAINVVKEAARAMATMPALMGLPLLQAIGLTIFLVPWVIYSVYLASSGDLVTVTATDSTGVSYNYKAFEYSTNTQYAFLYMLFSWFWTSQFIIAYGQMVVALAFVAWFFTHDKATIGTGTVTWSLKTVTWYHMGTAAFGALIIAIIKTIRAIIAYIQRKAAKSNNRILMVVMSALQCCMWVLEKCMKFLNKNAYIQTAIYGYSFCWAAKCAFFLILRNIMRVFAVSMVGDFILTLGKVFISVFTTFIAYLALSANQGEINGFVSPLIFVFILSWFVASMFTEIFGMGIETILMCFIADEEMFEPEKRFAENGLRSTMQVTAQQHAAGKVAPDAVTADTGTESAAPKSKVAPVSVKSSQGDGDALL